MLAARCGQPLGSDGIDKAVARDRLRLKDHPNVQLFKAWVPQE